jgi:hypothetical protein
LNIFIFDYHFGIIGGGGGGIYYVNGLYPSYNGYIEIYGGGGIGILNSVGINPTKPNNAFYANGLFAANNLSA